MSYSYTVTEATTFTVTNARYLASKVKTDLKRMERLYGRPTDSWIANFEAEIVALLKAGYLGGVAYGFRRDGNWIEPTLRYTAQQLASTAHDDDPGRVRPGANIAGASFYSYLTYNGAWYALTTAEREAFEKTLPFRRTAALEPGVSGYFQSDRTYYSGGWALGRASVRSYR